MWYAVAGLIGATAGLFVAAFCRAAHDAEEDRPVHRLVIECPMCARRTDLTVGTPRPTALTPRTAPGEWN